MKSNERTDQEIKAVADIWNGHDYRDLSSEDNEVCSMVYGALMWARGKRIGVHGLPSERLKKWLDRKKGS